MSPALPKSRLSTVATSPKHSRLALCTGLISILLSACGGGEPEADLRREPLAAGTTAKAASYDPNDLYRFFAVAFGAAPGVTYMGQLREAADAGMSIQQIVNVFTTKAQFLETYPANLTAQEFAQRLVDNVVGTSATASAKAEARGQVEAALASGMTRGDITFAIFNNLARKPANDAQWAGTARKMANQVIYAKHYTETMKVDTTDLTQLRAVVKTVTEGSATSGVDLGALIQSAVQTAIAQSQDRTPMARATSAQPAVTAGSTVQLDGSTSFDFLGRPLTYTWRLDSRPSGSAAALAASATTLASFVADVAGRYVATLQVSNATTSKSAQVVVTALPASAQTSALAVAAGFSAGACTALRGCSAQVLPDFRLTLNQCTLTKVGAMVAIARPGMEPVAADFDGNVIDRASLSGNQLTISLRGSLATDQVNIQIDAGTGAVTAATGSATVEGVTRTIDCGVVTSGVFPATAAGSSVASVADLLKAMDPHDCRSQAHGASFASCPSTALPDFSLNVGSCLLSKSGQTLTVTKAGSPAVSAKLNGDPGDGMGEVFNTQGVSLGEISLSVVDADAAASSQQSITLRITAATLAATLSAFDFSKSASTQISC